MYTTNFENIEKAEKHPSNHTVEKRTDPWIRHEKKDLTELQFQADPKVLFQRNEIFSIT